jgi:hypothetical protein
MTTKRERAARLELATACYAEERRRQLVVSAADAGYEVARSVLHYANTSSDEELAKDMLYLSGL